MSSSVAAAHAEMQPRAPTPTRAEREFGLMEPVLLSPPRVSSFIGYEAGPSVNFFSAGLKFAPAGDLYHSAPLVMIAGGAGILPVGGFRPTASIDVTQQIKLLAGYQFADAKTTVAVMLGASLAFDQQIWLDGRVARRTGFGPAIQVELWSKPSAMTLATASFAYTGGDGFSWLRMHWGRRLYGYTYAGPEFAVSTDGDYTQARFGLRLTGLGFGPVTFDLSAGAARDSRGSAGPYVTLSAYSSF